MVDQRLHAPATERNRDAILAVLRTLLATAGDVLEIASGTGQHAAFFANALPHLRWRPTDFNPAMLPSIAAWAEDAGASIGDPVQLDVTATPWPIDAADAIFCANMIHIAPWAASEGLFRGAESVVRPGGVLALYGPFKIDGQHTSESNVRFEGWLLARDPAFGVRDLGTVSALAARHGFRHKDTIEMPANNFIVSFER
ncbi:MAG: SAM-dependent methyltransferase [Myxococcota bacterium]|jgi:SAM-dependent methyltransferase